MPETQSPSIGPDAIGFDPPAPVFEVTADNVVLVESLRDLQANMRVAIPNPWSDEENYIVGIVRGAPDQWMLDIGKSLGKLELREQGWVCVGLASMAVLANSLALETMGVPAPKSFTARLLKKVAGKKTKAHS